MIITRQVIGCVSKSLSQQKTLKQKSDISLSRCPTFCSFLEHSSFPIAFFLSDKPCSTHTICFLYTRPSLVTAQSTVAVGAKVADKKFPLRPLFQNSAPPLLRTPHYSPLPPLKEYTNTNVV